MLRGRADKLKLEIKPVGIERKKGEEIFNTRMTLHEPRNAVYIPPRSNPSPEYRIPSKVLYDRLRIVPMMDHV